MERFCTIKQLIIKLIRCNYRGNGKYTYHNYITLLIFLKSRYIKYKILPILLPTYKKYLQKYT